MFISTATAMQHFDYSVTQTVLVRVPIAVKRHHDNGNSYKGKHLMEVVAYSSEVQSIIIMVGSMAACKQIWHWLHVNQKTMGSKLSHWTKLEHV